MFIPSTRELATPETIEDLAREHLATVERYKKLHAALADVGAADLPVYRYSGHNREYLDFSLEYTLTENLKDAWRSLIKRTQVEEACSATRWKGIEEQIRKGDIPEFTVENITALLQSFLQGLPEMFTEACREVLEWLRPGQWNTHKTNEKNARMEIGPKIIKEWVIDTSYGMVNLRYDREPILRSLHTVFKMLDGKGPARYPEDLPTLIKGAIRDKLWECENEYLRCKWHKNGNLHIWIKREDLLAEFNARVHGNTLREPVGVAS